MNIKKLLVAVMAVAVLSACNEKPVDEVPVEDLDFVLSVSELKPTSVKVACTPKDLYMPYVCMLIEKKIFDNNLGSDEALQNDNLAYFEYEAEENECTLYDVLNSFVITGELEPDLVDELTPNTEYYLYAYGLDYRGVSKTGVTKIEFKTPAYPDVEMKDYKFDIQVSAVTSTSATATVAGPGGVVYTLDLLSQEEYEYYGNNESAFAAYVEDEVSYYRSQGYTDEEILSERTLSATNVNVPCSSLTPSTTYYIFILAIDEYLRVCSNPTYVTITTEDVEPSSNTFTISITKCYSDGVSASVHPSNTDPFFWDIVSAESCQGKTDTEIIKMIVKKYGSSDLSELTNSEVAYITNANDLQPNTEYYICVFGWNAAPTTGLTKKKFTTAPPVDYSTLSLNLEAYGVAANQASIMVTPSDNDITYIYSICHKSVFDAKVAAKGNASDAVVELAEEEIEYYVNLYNGTYSASWVANRICRFGPDHYTFQNLSPDSEYVAWGAAINTANATIAGKKGFYVEFKTLAE